MRKLGPRCRARDTGRGGCGCWPLDSLALCLNYSQNTRTYTSYPRTAKSISDSVTNVIYKNHWPTDVSGKPIDCLDFKTANTQNLTFNTQIQSDREPNLVSTRGQTTQNAPGGAQKIHWQPLWGSSYCHTGEYGPRGCKKVLQKPLKR